MQIYPAIDIIDGKAVRLSQGSFEDVLLQKKMIMKEDTMRRC